MNNIIYLTWLKDTKYEITQKIYLYPHNKRIHKQCNISYGTIIPALYEAVRIGEEENVEINIKEHLNLSYEFLHRENYSFNKYELASLHGYIIYEDILNKCKEYVNKYSEINDEGLAYLQSYVNRRINTFNSHLISTIIENSKTEDLSKTFDFFLTSLKDNIEEEINTKESKFLTTSLKEYAEKEEINKDIKKSLEAYLKDGNGNGSRCFASFIKKENKDRYIAFSGYLDIDDPIIRKWSKKRNDEAFVDVLRSIANDNNAKLVTTNMHTSVFVKDRPNEQINIRYDINYYINNNIEFNDVNKKLSCCERKIFGYFNNKTPSGELYVKFQMCSICDLGKQYQEQQNTSTVINVHY